MMSNSRINQIKTSDSCGCRSGSQTESVQQERKQLTIDFMYIDLEVCTRCKRTEENLNDAIAEVANLLKTIGYDVRVNSIFVENEEQAEALRFVSSPTIRINGKDIQLTTKESNCDTCGSITGSNVDCRVWIYEGKEYTEAPKPLIINAILKEVYGAGQNTEEGREEPYVLPENLNLFFTAKREDKHKDCCTNGGSVQCC